MNLIREPFYLVDFKSTVSNFEIFINGFPAFSYYRGGEIASHYPINHFFLESGKQDIKIRIFPLAGEEFLKEDSRLEVKVHFYDSFTNDYNNLVQVFKFESPNFANNHLPYIEFDSKFEVEIPYKNDGWRNANVLDIKKDISTNIISAYKKIHMYAEEEDFENLYELMKIKFTETDNAFYTYNSDNKKELENVFKNLKSENFILSKFPDKPIINLYCENKITDLIREDGNPILHYINNETKDEFALPIFLCFKDFKPLFVR